MEFTLSHIPRRKKAGISYLIMEKEIIKLPTRFCEGYIPQHTARPKPHKHGENARPIEFLNEYEDKLNKKLDTDGQT